MYLELKPVMPAQAGIQEGSGRWCVSRDDADMRRRRVTEEDVHVRES